MVFQLRVKTPKGEEIIIHLCDCKDHMKTITVQQLKQIINKICMTDDNLDLIFGTEILEEKNLLLSYNIKHFSTIHTVVKLPGGI